MRLLCIIHDTSTYRPLPPYSVFSKSVGFDSWNICFGFFVVVVVVVVFSNHRFMLIVKNFHIS